MNKPTICPSCGAVRSGGNAHRIVFDCGCKYNRGYYSEDWEMLQPCSNAPMLLQQAIEDIVWLASRLQTDYFYNENYEGITKRWHLNG